MLRAVISGVSDLEWFLLFFFSSAFFTSLFIFTVDESSYSEIDLSLL